MGHGTQQKYECDDLHSEKISKTGALTMINFDQMFNYFVLIKPPNIYAIIRVRYSFWSVSSTSFQYTV
jgi:hypothetical protein